MHADSRNSQAHLKKAQKAPRCNYMRLNEQKCTQPALHGGGFCRFHDLAVENPLPDPRLIPFVEDATTLQLALMQVIKALQLGKMTRPVAGTILYALQIAAQNLPHLCEEIGHPFADRASRGKKKEEEDDDDPSLVEYLIEQLQLEPPPADDDAEAPSDHKVSSVGPMTRSSDEPIRSDLQIASSPDHQMHSPTHPITHSPNPGVVDDLKACMAIPAGASKIAVSLIG